MLAVTDIHTFYGRSYILRGVSLEIQIDEIVCVLGRNGVGKTTTLKSIMGIVVPRSGQVLFAGKRITGLSPHLVSKMGIGYVPEDRRIFHGLTVRENLNLGFGNVRSASDSWKRDRLETIFRHFPILKERMRQAGDTLSGGEQQMLAIARSLVGDTRLMLLDEPTEGLSPLVVKNLLRIIQEIRQSGVAILLVEQNAKIAIQISDRGYILEKGVVCFMGTKQELETSTVVRERCGI
jgi:branched-chain amino acid transport system ATP-binding protein